MGISISNGVMVMGGKVVIDGKEYPFPKGVKGKSQTIINGKVYIDGYELKNGKWKKTILAFWHTYF